MSQSAELTTDNETLTVATVKQFPDTCASTGTISGTIQDAVDSSVVVSDVSLSIRSGMNTTSGTIFKTAITDSSGNYSLSSMSAGWYTIQFSKTGYITGNFNVYSCGSVGSQNSQISTPRIMKSAMDTVEISRFQKFQKMQNFILDRKCFRK